MPSQGPWKAYVGNLTFDLPSETITAFFEHDGNIRVVTVIVPKRFEEKPTSHVYVEFADRESLENALKLDGQDLQGRPVKIDVAAARQDSRQGGGFGDRRAPEPRPESDIPKERKKLTLAPRSAVAAAATTSSAAAAASKPDPFGGAKPREETLVARGVDPTSLDAEKEKKKAAAGDWQDVKPELKTNPANAPKRAADAPSHPTSATAANAASSAPRGVMRGGVSRPVGTRPGLGDARKAPQGQAPPSKKEKAAPSGPSNVFSALAGDDEEEQEE